MAAKLKFIRLALAAAVSFAAIAVFGGAAAAADAPTILFTP